MLQCNIVQRIFEFHLKKLCKSIVSTSASYTSFHCLNHYCWYHRHPTRVYHLDCDTICRVVCKEHGFYCPKVQFCSEPSQIYRKISNIKCTFVGNKIIDHSDVVGASPVTCRRCSNYIFILYLTTGFSGLGNNNCKTRQKRHSSLRI